MTESYDVAIIGGGPGGSTFATLAADAGLKVALFERQSFPRHIIGESLLPQNMPLFRRLQIADKLESHGYQRKHGAVFTNEATDFSRKVFFKDAFNMRDPHAYQVDREPFDQLLLDRAREAGAEIFQPAKVEQPVMDGDRVIGLTYTAERRQSIESTFCVDCSGRSAFFSKHLSKKDRDPVLNQSSAYAYYDRLTYATVAEQGDIEIVQTDTGWCWIIPLRPDRISIGAIFTKEQIKATRGGVKSLFESLLNSSSVMAKRLEGANRVSEVLAIPDYSYQVVQTFGPGWISIGDAALFVDPVFSSGVFLSTVCAERAFDEFLPALAAGHAPANASYLRYQRWVNNGLKRFKKYIYGYYTPGFRKVFYSDPPHHAFRRAVTANLAGDVFEPTFLTRFFTGLFWFFVALENRNHRKQSNDNRTE